MSNYKENIINKVQVENTEYPISYTETEYQDETNNFRRYKGDLALRKVYTGVLGVANGSAPNNNTYANTSFYFLNVKPDSWYVEWTVKYHLNIHLDDENQVYKNSSGTTYYPGQTMRGLYDCMISGTQGAYSTFHFFQSQKNTSYRPIYYHMTHSPTSAGHTAGLPFKIGISLASSYLPTPTANYQSGSAVTTKYSRTIEVVVDEAINCEVSLNDILEIEADAYEIGDMLNYTKLSSTYYTTSTSASNSAGRWNNLSATTQGLYESGDDNTYTYTQQTSSYLTNGTKNGNTNLRINGYQLFGFGSDGKALGLSVYSSSQTTYTTSMSVKGTRLYCTLGFDYTKGIRYTNSSSNFAAGGDLNISSSINHAGIDLRYSDNCTAAAASTVMGLVVRQPIYLRGTIGDDGLFYLAPIDVSYSSKTYQRAWVQERDGFEEGYVYWFFGIPYYNSSYLSAYQFDLVTQGELSIWDGTQLVPYSKGNTVEDIFTAVYGTDYDFNGPSNELSNLSNDFKAAIIARKDFIYTDARMGIAPSIKMKYEGEAAASATTYILIYTSELWIFADFVQRAIVTIDTSTNSVGISTQNVYLPHGLCMDTNGNVGLYDGDMTTQPFGLTVASSNIVESGLPSFSSSNENYVLSVDSSGNLVWRAPYNGEASGS